MNKNYLFGRALGILAIGMFISSCTRDEKSVELSDETDFSDKITLVFDPCESKHPTTRSDYSLGSVSLKNQFFNRTGGNIYVPDDVNPQTNEVYYTSTNVYGTFTWTTSGSADLTLSKIWQTGNCVYSFINTGSSSVTITLNPGNVWQQTLVHNENAVFTENFSTGSTAGNPRTIHVSSGGKILVSYNIQGYYYG